MSNRITDHISYTELFSYFTDAESLITKLPKSWPSTHWKSILNGTMSIDQLSAIEKSLSAEQVSAYEKLLTIINKINSKEASDKDKAIASIYRSYITIYKLLPISIAQALVESIQFQSEYLDLSENNIDDLQAIAIAEILPCTQISSLILRNNQIKNNGAIALANTNLLTTLNLGNNQINIDRNIAGEKSADAVAIAFSQCTSISDLSLDGSKFSIDGHKALFANPRIKKISFNHAHISTEIAQLYATSTTIGVIHLDENELDPNTIISLANNEFFVGMSLRYNNISDAVAAVLAQSKNLQTLDISHCNLSDKGIAAFANTTIKELYSSNNKLTSSAPSTLAANPHILITDFSHNNVAEVAIQTLSEEDPTKSYNIAITAGATPEFPSLKRLSLFKTKKTATPAATTVLPTELKEDLNKNKM